MSATLTAVILAAGVNRRLGQADRPKSLLPLTRSATGPTFLSRHAEMLQMAGVERIVVVVSESVLPQCPDLNGVRFVVNPFDTSATGSSLSLLCAIRDLGEDATGLVVMDADIVYERALMGWVIDRCQGSRLFVTPVTAGDDEEVKVYGRGPEHPTLIGKGFRSSMVEGLDLLGESLGVIHIDAKDLGLLRDSTEWLSGWPPEHKAYGFAKDRSEHEEIWQYLINLGRLSASRIPNDLLFSECDTQEDYARVVDTVFPAIIAKDAAGLA